MRFTWHTIPNALLALSRVLQRVFSTEPVMATNYVAEQRVERCMGCPWFIRDSRQCHKCTCLVDLKVLVASESCPDMRWFKQTRLTSGL